MYQSHPKFAGFGYYGLNAHIAVAEQLTELINLSYFFIQTIYLAVVADRKWISNVILRHIYKRHFSFFALFRACLASTFTKSDI
jgi:hypothetical protein